MMARGQSLYDWCQENGEWGQQLMNEWVGLDEDNNNVNMTEISCKNNRKVKWKCLHGHLWGAQINNRVIHRSNCPYCSGKIAHEDNNLATWCSNNGEYGQKLINEWVGVDSDNNKIDMMNVTYGSNKKVKWKCENGHVWEAKILSRTSTHKTGCKLCGYEAIGNKHKDRLLSIGKNDLLTWCQNNEDWGKQLISEWGCESSESMDMYTYASSDKVTWICNSNDKHIWKASISSRTLGRTGCPHCNTNGTSYTEQMIYQSLKELYINCQNRYKAFNNIEYDIVLPDEKIYIEYSPKFTHKSKEKRDKLKAQLCIDNNIRFIYISDDFIYDTETKEYITIKDNNEDMIEKVLKLLGHSIQDINFEAIRANAYVFSHGKIAKESQLSTVFPEIIREIHKDNKLDLEMIAFDSCKYIMWRCNKCGYGDKEPWKVRVVDRTRYKTGCPCCGYNCFDGSYHIGSSIVKKGFNDLCTLCPELVKEWHDDNDNKPSEFKMGSHKVIMWKCTQCGYGESGEWKKTINSRTAKGKETGCPNCGYNWYKAQTGQPQKLKKMKPRSQVQSLSEFI